jgi:hypothetical protein
MHEEEEFEYIKVVNCQRIAQTKKENQRSTNYYTEN